MREENLVEEAAGGKEEAIQRHEREVELLGRNDVSTSCVARHPMWSLSSKRAGLLPGAWSPTRSPGRCQAPGMTKKELIGDPFFSLVFTCL